MSHVSGPAFDCTTSMASTGLCLFYVPIDKTSVADKTSVCLLLRFRSLPSTIKFKWLTENVVHSEWPKWSINSSSRIGVNTKASSRWKSISRSIHVFVNTLEDICARRGFVFSYFLSFTAIFLSPISAERSEQAESSRGERLWCLKLIFSVLRFFTSFIFGSSTIVPQREFTNWRQNQQVFR